MLWLIFLVLLIAYITSIFILKRKGLLEKYNCSLWGPLLMWKTERGKNLIERIAKKKRFWIWFANIGIAVCFIAMIGMSLLLLWDILVVSKIPAGRAPSPRMMIGLPGINPFIPIGYGILALVVGIVVHEFSHGILARVGNIKVKSLGLLFFIVPLGAFTEPDEDELEKVGKKKRARVFAAGPMANIVVALVCASIFSIGFMGTVEPAQEGLIIEDVVDDSPIARIGIEPWSLLTSIDGREIRDEGDFCDAVSNTTANQTVEITTYYEGSASIRNATAGIVVASVAPEYPADRCGIEVGMIISEIGHVKIKSEEDFYEVMESTGSGQEIAVGGYEYDEEREEYMPWEKTVKLANKYDYTKKEVDDGKGFLGIGVLPMGINVVSPRALSTILAHPLTDIRSFLFYITLPFYGLSPFPSQVTSIYETPILPSNIFWILANSFYWIFWLNFALGTFNALPAVPLDGGYLFKDGIDVLIGKMRKKWEKKKRERVVSKIVTGMALLILAAILSIMFLPRLLPFFI